MDLENDQEIKQFIKKHYEIFLEREPDENGLQYYFDLLKNQKIKSKELKRYFEESVEHKRLKSKIELVDKISKDLESILAGSKTFEEYIEQSQRKQEPEHIFVT